MVGDSRSSAAVRVVMALMLVSMAAFGGWLVYRAGGSVLRGLGWTGAPGKVLVGDCRPGYRRVYCEGLFFPSASDGAPVRVTLDDGRRHGTGSWVTARYAGHGVASPVTSAAVGEAAFVVVFGLVVVVSTMVVAPRLVGGRPARRLEKVYLRVLIGCGIVAALGVVVYVLEGPAKT